MTIEQQIDALGSKLSFKPAGKNSEAAMRLERNMVRINPYRIGWC